MKNTRNSSFELLRIILILMIMVEHGNMWFFGAVYNTELEYLAKCSVQSVCIGSVNAFVLMSGWFGIRRSFDKIGDLLFIMLYCTIPLLFAEHRIKPAATFLVGFNRWGVQICVWRQ